MYRYKANFHFSVAMRRKCGVEFGVASLLDGFGCCYGWEQGWAALYWALRFSARSEVWESLSPLCFWLLLWMSPLYSPCSITAMAGGPPYPQELVWQLSIHGNSSGHNANFVVKELGSFPTLQGASIRQFHAWPENRDWLRMLLISSWAYCSCLESRCMARELGWYSCEESSL